MTTTVSPTRTHTTLSGAPLPVAALPQGELVTVNIDQIPLFKDIVAPGVHIKPLRLDAERGEWVVLATLEPGATLPIHYHTGVVQVWTIQGRWYYREYLDQPQVAGSYLYELGGSVHTFFCPEDNTEDTVAVAWIEGAAINFNEDGTLHSIMDATSIQHSVDKAVAEQGLGPVPYIRGGSAGPNRS
jgi:quercetin dioxygenase-like cupin family protein